MLFLRERSTKRGRPTSLTKKRDALIMLTSGLTEVQTAERLEVSVRTVQRWKRQVRETGVVE